MEPLAPDDATPVPMTTAPLAALFDCPVDSVMAPDDPVALESAVRTKKSPDAVAPVPAPVVMVMAPPDAPPVPPMKLMEPPTFVLPAPPVSKTLPPVSPLPALNCTAPPVPEPAPARIDTAPPNCADPAVASPAISSTFPPVCTALLPADREIVPVAPLVDAPVEMSTSPDLPLTARPEVMEMEPVAPLVPDAAVAIVTAPDDVDDVPAPDVMVTSPPMAVPCPDAMYTLPPVEVVPVEVPPTSDSAPPIVDAAAAEPAENMIADAFSVDDVPPMMEMAPDCCWPDPDAMTTLPPVRPAAVVVAPAVMVTLPPAPLADVPVLSVMLPAAPCADTDDVEIVTPPLEPLTDAPVWMVMLPEVPTPVDAAVEIDTPPLLLVAALEPWPDVMVMPPPNVVPTPDRMDTDPPVDVVPDAVPDDSSSEPAVPLATLELPP